jgi:hypothetical protein
MTKFVFIGLACLAFSAADPDCIRFHTGTFKSNTSVGIFTITRLKDKQIERMKGSNLVCEFKLKWTSSCSYLLYDKKMLEGIDDTPKEFLFDTLYCDIIDVKEKNHTVFCHLKDQEGVEFVLENVK